MPAMAEMMEPFVFTLRSVLERLVMARLVVVALASVVDAVTLSVPAPESKVKSPPFVVPKRMVEEALMPDCAKKTDEVAAFTTPKLFNQVNAAAPAEVWSCAQPNVPLVQVWKNPAWQVVRPVA